MSLQKKEYTWTGISKNGKNISGLLFAHSLSLAKMYLTQQGITPIILRKKRFHLLKRSSHKIHSRDITLFFRQLATLMPAGIPIVQCCQILSTSEENESLKSLINTIKLNLESGKGLSFSLQQFPAYFDSVSYHLIYMSEQTGKLDQILLQIAHHKEKNEALKKQLQQALLYPTIITCVATTVTLIMLIFVVPRFAELFQTMQKPLPFFTKCVIQLSSGMLHDYWLMVFPFLVILFFKYQLKKSTSLQILWHQLQLCLPFWGAMQKKIILARFARNLTTTLAAGLPILEALTLIAGTLENLIYEKALKQMQVSVASGQSLCHAMRQIALFPEFMIQLTQVGEESGQMEQMQAKIANTFENDIELFVSRLSTLLEPLIITILGALIGCVVIALYLPIFKLGTVI